MTTCGGVEHPAECLCDVVITEVTPINYGFDQVWHAGIVARAVGYKGGGGTMLADYLEALGSAYDATRRLAGLDSGWLDDIGRSGGTLKPQVEALLQDGHSIIDVPDMLGESHERIVAAITGCVPCLIWTWDDFKWLEFESYLVTKTAHSATDLATMFGLTRSQCTTLIKLYGKGFEDGRAKARAQRASDLFDEHQDKDAAEIHAMLAAEGHEYTLDGVRKARQRWRFRRNGVYAAAVAAAGWVTVAAMVKLMVLVERLPSGVH